MLYQYCKNILNKILLIIVIVAICLCFNPVKTNASNPTVTITVRAWMLVAENFTITYINDKQLDLSWSIPDGIDNVMIRSKYGSEPLDIPNEYTTPSDGNLVYYGNDTEFSDTSMDFDETASVLYYKLWSQRADGTWSLVTSTGSKESQAMALLAILMACVILTIGGFAIKRPAIAFLASGFWLANIVYCFFRYDTLWDTYYVVGFISIAGVIICAIDGAMILNKKEEKQEEDDDGIDPDIKELMKDRELMYKEISAIRGRPTIKNQRKGLLP